MNTLVNSSDVLDFLNNTSSSTGSLADILVGIFFALIIGLIISITNLKTSKIKASQSYLLTIIIIPISIFLVIYLIGNNVATAFGLAGAFSIVKFRSEQESSKDIAYIFFAMAGGLACGLGYYLYGLLFTIILCLIMALLMKLNFASDDHTTTSRLKILVPENLDFENVFESLLEKNTLRYELVRVKTVDLGSLYELIYEIEVEKKLGIKEFLDEIRCYNGNLTVSLFTSREVA